MRKIIEIFILPIAFLLIAQIAPLLPEQTAKAFLFQDTPVMTDQGFPAVGLDSNGDWPMVAGWNEEGIPTSEKLEELDIGWASNKITEQI